jgi:hypothetical protein
MAGGGMVQEGKARAGHNVLRYCEGGTTVYTVLILNVNLVNIGGLYQPVARLLPLTNLANLL